MKDGEKQFLQFVISRSCVRVTLPAPKGHRFGDVLLLFFPFKTWQLFRKYKVFPRLMQHIIWMCFPSLFPASDQLNKHYWFPAAHLVNVVNRTFEDTGSKTGPWQTDETL